MSDFWTIDGMYDSKKKKKKKNKDKDKDKGHKDSKSKKNKKKEKKNKHEFSYEAVQHQKSTDAVYVPYSDFLKNDGEGIYIVKTMVADVKLETYIVKSEEFDFPRVALSKSGDSYKDWLRKKIESINSDVNVNKVLYGSSVKRIDIPKGLLVKIIKNSKSDD